MKNNENTENRQPVKVILFVILIALLMAGISFGVATFVHNHNSAQTVSTVKNGLSAYELAVEQAMTEAFRIG